MRAAVEIVNRLAIVSLPLLHCFALAILVPHAKTKLDML